MQYALNGDVLYHNDSIKWKHFPRYWPFVREIHRPPVNSPHKGEWRGALMFSLICVWTNGLINNRNAGDLRRHRAHCDFTVMCRWGYIISSWQARVIYSANEGHFTDTGVISRLFQCQWRIPGDYAFGSMCSLQLTTPRLRKKVWLPEHGGF